MVPDNDETLRDGATVVRLTPGLAFGTGEHPTTEMCLRWLDGLELHDSAVLDYGCGSGILGLAAAALGARSVTLTDIDPQALTATTDNLAANGLAGPANLVTAPKNVTDVSHDILLANILSNTLIELGPTLDKLMRPGAKLAITGILADQADSVIAAWSEWADMAVGDQVEDWILLTGTKLGLESGISAAES